MQLEDRIELEIWKMLRAYSDSGIILGGTKLVAECVKGIMKAIEENDPSI